MKCVILQPSYIPWRGFFHQIQKADTFIFYDDVQYDRRGWRHRNKIKTPHGLKWLSIPTQKKRGDSGQNLINQIKINWDGPWNSDHWNTIKMAYHKAPYFSLYEEMLEYFYQQKPVMLADFTIDTTIALARKLGIQHTHFIRSSELHNITGHKTDRLINILIQIGANHYISGPSARDYIEEEKFLQAGITLEYMHYNYPAYEQFYAPYEPQVSILDLMFMHGPETMNYCNAM